ncbi:Uncharacterised protein [Mycolicibacterium vanbaalenii]|uniref:Uncharacterized protein n=1 Tax=Mycolicibacterium vanbaalenii TaxID=110539 RepID=A0A5S9R948_MYCVN|nr:Uncharacterised protein [Mycolicibacterium vanbaalenii]
MNALNALAVSTAAGAISLSCSATFSKSFGSPDAAASLSALTASPMPWKPIAAVPKDVAIPANIAGTTRPTWVSCCNAPVNSVAAVAIAGQEPTPSAAALNTAAPNGPDVKRPPRRLNPPPPPPPPAPPRPGGPPNGAAAFAARAAVFAANATVCRSIARVTAVTAPTSSRLAACAFAALRVC